MKSGDLAAAGSRFTAKFAAHRRQPPHRAGSLRTSRPRGRRPTFQLCSVLTFSFAPAAEFRRSKVMHRIHVAFRRQSHHTMSASVSRTTYAKVVDNSTSKYSCTSQEFRSNPGWGRAPISLALVIDDPGPKIAKRGRPIGPQLSLQKIPKFAIVHRPRRSDHWLRNERAARGLTCLRLRLRLRPPACLDAAISLSMGSSGA